MKGMSLSPGDYVHFKSLVPVHKITIGAKQWKYYDFGPKAVSPLVCIPGIAGNADVYYKQIMCLSMKGYRVISIDIPCVWNYHEWVHAFEKFLDTINVYYVHLYGTSLGGFLAQLFAQHRPRRVKSLVLSNTFLETRKFSAAMPWAPVLSWTPSFLLKRYILSGIRDGPHEPFIADSIDFIVGQVERLSVEDLSSRLTLNANVVAVGRLLLLDSFITLMDMLCHEFISDVVEEIFDCQDGKQSAFQTYDYCAIPQQLKDKVSERYPGARRAILKTGGDFPFLSRADEVNLHLQLHLRHVGVESNPVSVQDVSRNGNAGNSTNEKNGGGGFDDPQEDSGNLGHDDRDETNQSEPSGSGSSKLDEQLLSNVRLYLMKLETTPLLVHEPTLYLALHLYVATLCIFWKPSMVV